MPLTAQNVQQFQAEGYTICHHFFDEREVSAMLSELDRFVREGLGRNVATDGDGKTHSKTRTNYQVIPLSPKSDLFRALPWCPRVRDAVSRLIGDPYLHHLDQIFLKPPHTGSGTGWHQDNGYFRISDPTKGTGMWIALHDATEENGTMHVIPNGHREALEHERDPGSDHHIRCKVEESAALAVVMEAGGALFFNYGVPHCTKSNRSDKPRAGCAYHFLRADFVPSHYPDNFSRPMVTGPSATGGRKEYGVLLDGAWEREVQRLTARIHSAAFLCRSSDS